MQDTLFPKTKTLASARAPTQSFNSLLRQIHILILNPRIKLVFVLELHHVIHFRVHGTKLFIERVDVKFVHLELALHLVEHFCVVAVFILQILFREADLLAVHSIVLAVRNAHGLFFHSKHAVVLRQTQNHITRLRRIVFLDLLNRMQTRLLDRAVTRLSNQLRDHLFIHILRHLHISSSQPTNPFSTIIMIPSV